MASLYKYLPIKYAEKLINENCLKIGTLFSYRNTEKFGLEIGDSDEGIRIEYSHDKEQKRGDQLNPLESAAIKGAGPGMIFQNNYIERRHHSENVYLYCLSECYSTAIMNKLNEDFPDEKYDACIEIYELKKFVEAINTCFSHKGRYLGLHKCCYIERKQHYSVQVPHPAIIKDPKYSYQAEVRLIWEPLNKDELREEIINVEHLKQFCRLC